MRDTSGTLVYQVPSVLDIGADEDLALENTTETEEEKATTTTIAVSRVLVARVAARVAEARVGGARVGS